MYFKIIGIIVLVLLASTFFRPVKVILAKTWINNLKGPISKLSQLLFERKYKNVKVEEVFDNIYQIEQFLLREFKYKYDPLYGIIDIINSPQKSYATKKLDCDDYSTLAMWLLSSLKIEAQMVTVVTEDIKSSHSVCFFTWCTRNNCIPRFAVFNNGELEQVDNFEDVLRLAAEGQDILCWNIMDKNLKVIAKGEGYETKT